MRCHAAMAPTLSRDKGPLTLRARASLQDVVRDAPTARAIGPVSSRRKLKAFTIEMSPHSGPGLFGAHFQLGQNRLWSRAVPRVFHFTRRVHRSARLDAVADGHGVRGR